MVTSALAFGILIFIIVAPIFTFYIYRSFIEKRGSVDLRVTDRAPEGIANLFVTTDNIEVKSNADPTESGWLKLVSTETTFDLVSLVGVEESLGVTELSAGKYGQLRMGIVKVVAVKTDGTKVDVTVPSSVLRLVKGFIVPESGTVILTIDFDVEKSLIITGKGGITLKPVVQLLSRPANEEFDSSKTF